MWEAIADRVRENEAEDPQTFRRQAWDVLRNASLRPGAGATKKMVAFTFGTGDRLLWEVQTPSNFFLHRRWDAVMAAQGFAPQPRPYVEGMKDGGRHSALSRSWSFGTEDCVALRLETSGDLHRLLATLGGTELAINLDPTAVERWIAELRRHFPNLDRFDGPDAEFDARERAYKIEFADRLRAAFADCAETQGYVDSFLDASAQKLPGGAYNLIDWRLRDRLRKHPSKADMDTAIHHVRTAAGAAPSDDGLAEFMRAMERAWDPPTHGSWDPARQLAEAIAMHLFPDSAIFFRSTVLQELYRDGVGRAFPRDADAGGLYLEALRFGRAVRRAFDARGLAPRDMVDVQSALWVVHSYGKKDAEMLDAADTPLAAQERSMPLEPVNLILYGPPGTGKTFYTAVEAVRLCGEQVPLDRAALMTVYQKLISDGRIEFVTFHQSMSYEEFVEGLRPTTGDDANAGPSSPEHGTGFRLEPHDGVFKRISERARLDPGKDGDRRGLDRQRNLFKLSLIGTDWRDQLQSTLAEGRIFWGFGAGVDWTAPEFEDFEAIKQRWRESDPEKDGRSADISGTWYFRGAVDVGDYVLLSVGKNRIVGLAEVLGDYERDPGKVREHSRRVRWIWHDADGAERSAFYPESFSAFQPMYQLAADRVDWDALDTIVFGATPPDSHHAPRHYVLIIDEINRANISKVFGELITLLEADKRLGADNELRLTLPYSKRPFGVPENLHVIGTMNTADRSIALLDTALRRRFTFREMMPDASVLGGASQKCGIDLARLLSTINERIEYLYDREHQIGHAYFTACRSRAKVDEVMRHKVIPLLAEYFFEDWAKIAVVLGDFEPQEGTITGGFLKRSVLKTPPGLEDGEGRPRYRWEVRTVDEGFDYGKLVGA